MVQLSAALDSLCRWTDLNELDIVVVRSWVVGYMNLSIVVDNSGWFVDRRIVRAPQSLCGLRLSGEAKRLLRFGAI